MGFCYFYHTYTHLRHATHPFCYLEAVTIIDARDSSSTFQRVVLDRDGYVRLPNTSFPNFPVLCFLTSTSKGDILVIIPIQRSIKMLGFKIWPIVIQHVEIRIDRLHRKEAT